MWSNLVKNNVVKAGAAINNALLPDIDYDDEESDEEYDVDDDQQQILDQQQQQQQQQQESSSGEMFEQDLGGEGDPQHQQYHHQPADSDAGGHGEEGEHGGVAVGGGMFMGRFTRFIDRVTQADDDHDNIDQDDSYEQRLDDDEDDGGNAWHDDSLDFSNNNDGDGGDNIVISKQQQQQQQQQQQPVVQQQQQQQNVGATAITAAANQQQQQQQQQQFDEGFGGGDDDAWQEDDLFVDEIIDSDELQQQQQQQQQPPPPDTSAGNNAAAAGPAVPLGGNAGGDDPHDNDNDDIVDAWQEDDDLDFHDDEGEIIVSNDDQQQQQQIPVGATATTATTTYEQGKSNSFVEAIHPPPPPPPTEDVTSSAQVQHEDNISPSTPQNSGRKLVDRTPPASPFHSFSLATDLANADAAQQSNNNNMTASANISLNCCAASEDLTRDTGGVDSVDDDEIYDDENELDYGPVVDHTPKKTTFGNVPLSRQNSLAVQAQSQVDEGWDDEDDLEGGFGDEQPGIELPMLPAGESTNVEEEEHMVDHTPADEGKPETVRDMSVGVLLSENDSTHVSQDDNFADYGPVVDKTPVSAHSSLQAAGVISAANSMAVQYPALQEDFEQDDAMEETCYGDSTDGWGQDDGDLDDIDNEDMEAALLGSATEPSGMSELSDGKSADDKLKIEHAAAATRSSGDHVVDHLPQEITEPAAEKGNPDPSVVVLVTREDISRDTGGTSKSNVYDDENEMEFGPVVDQTPTTPSASVVFPSGTNSVAVQAPEINEEIQEDDAMDETAFDEDYEDDDEIGFEQSISVKVEQPTMVDHTPSEMGTPVVRDCDPSVDVLPSEATSTKPGDNDSAGGNEDFGPVVDQTPQTPGQETFAARSDSVVVQVHDLETVDETYGDYNADEDDGGDTLDSEMPSTRRSLEALEDKLVDHIPLRPESRMGDASLRVAADPSEVLSEVDDMAQEEEEGNFGPVVDVTPPTGPGTTGAGVPSATGSTATGSTVVVAPASVAADDLDGDAEEETATREDQDQGGYHHGGDVDGTPNPQSGNDESVTNEQLVDFLPPPQNEQEGNDQEPSLEGREPPSELTLRGEQSLMPTLDAKEDEYGPVVDLTPVPQPVVAHHPSGLSHASTSTQLTASECRALEREDDTEAGLSSVMDKSKVVDQLPQMRLPADSIASTGGSQLAEDEEDDSKFGPVVDHLPTPRTSLAPSRGGSTVDALATVSEVNSDDDGGEGWDEDDADIDISDSGVVSDGSALQKAAATALRRPAASDQERSVSVRFEPSVDDCHESPESGGTGLLSQTHYYDPEMGANQAQAQAFAEAETPPSTPGRQPHVLEEFDLGMAVQCASCYNAKTIECPCVQKLLRINTENGALTGTIKTEEGDTIQMDFSKMLQDEITKRQFIEEEVKSTRREVSLMAGKESQLQVKVNLLQEIESALGQELAYLKSGCSALEEEKLRLTSELESSRESLNDYEQRTAAWSAKESALQAEVQNLKHSLDESVARLSADGDVAKEMTSLQAELASKIGECEELRTQVAQLQVHMEESGSHKKIQKAEINDLSKKLEEAIAKCEQMASDYQILLKDSQVSDQKVEEYTQKVMTQRSELESMHKSRDELVMTVEELRTKHEAEMHEQYQLLDTKTAEIRSLEAATKSLENDKGGMAQELAQQRSLAEQSESLAEELLAVAKERDLLQDSLAESKATVDSLQKTVEEHGMEQEAVESRRDAEVSTLRAEVKKTSAALAEKESEAVSLAAEMDAISRGKGELERMLQESQAAYQSLEEEAKTLKVRCIQEEENNVSAQKQINLLRDQVNKLTEEIKHSEAERQKLTSHLAALGRTLQRVEEEAAIKASKTQELEELVSQSKDEVASLTKENCNLVAERDSLFSRFKDVELQSTQALEQAQHQYQQLLETYNLETSELKSENQKVLDQLLKEQSLAKDLASEKNALTGRCREMEAQSVRLSKEAEEKMQQLNHQYQRVTSELTEAKQRLEHQLTEQHSSIEFVTSERDTLLLKYQELEQTSAQSIQQAEQRLHQASQVHNQKLRELEQAKARSDQELKSISEELQNVRDDLKGVVQDRDTLSGENEEMLVQFGLLEHQMNASEEHVRVLQKELEAIHASEEEAEQVAASAAELERLAQELGVVSLEKSQLEAQVNSLLDERTALQAHVQSLEYGTGDGTEARYQELNERCQQQEDKIRSLTNQGTISNSSPALQERIEELEVECASKQRSLVESDAQLSTIQEQLEAKEVELNSLLQNVHEKDGRIRELEETQEETEEKLSYTRDQLAAAEATRSAEANLATFEAAIEDLELNNNTSEATRVIADYEKRMKKLEGDLSDKNNLVSQLQDSVSNLQFQLESGMSQASFNLSHRDVGGLPTVLDSSEHNRFNHDEELNSLKKQVESLESSLQETREILVSKDQEVDRLSSELTNLQCREASQLTPEKLAAVAAAATTNGDNNINRDDDIDTLRSHVVSLAVALERSETRRAEAISRLLSERENNANSLRKLSESVKRFYSSVSHRDG